MGLRTANEHQALQDQNRYPVLIASSGTPGTSDTSGTQEIVRVGANPATGALYVQDLSGATGTTNITGTVVASNLETGTLSLISNLNSGSVVVTSGTLGSVSNLAMIHAGTVVVPSGTVTTIAAGTQNTLGTVAVINNIVTGTLAALSSLTTGSVANIAMIHAGTTVQPSGTVTTIVAGTQNTLGTVGVINNIVTGTLAASGTTTGVGVVTTVTTVSNLTIGSVRMTVGTLTTGTLQNLVTGTINALASGTITGGTLGNLNYGTIALDMKPAGSNILTTHTLGTGGGTFFGTMVSPVGAGTYIYLTGISIVGRSGGSIDVGVSTNVAGSTGAGVIARGFFPTAGGGIRQEFLPPLRIGTNGTLAYFLITAGTADFTAQYWVGP